MEGEYFTWNVFLVVLCLRKEERRRRSSDGKRPLSVFFLHFFLGFAIGSKLDSLTRVCLSACQRGWRTRQWQIVSPFILITRKKKR